MSYSLTLAIQTEKIAQDLLLITDDVIGSTEVQRVLRVWRAVATEDFVGFFKLLRGADFLLSTLMNRFVPRMRLQALRLLNKHTGKQGDTADTGRITRLLCFDDVTECAQVCSQLELQCDTNSIYLNPARPVQSSVKSLPLLLIGQKNALQLGEVVHGAQLPPFQPRPPTFRRHNEEPGPVWGSVVESLVELETAACVESEVRSGVEEVARDVLLEGQKQQLIGRLNEELGGQVLLQGVLGLVQGEAERELAEQREEQLKRRERNLFIDRLSAELFASLQHQLIGQIAAGELEARRDRAALESRAAEEVCLSTYSALESDMVWELLRLAGEAALQEARERRKERLEEQRRCVTLIRLRNLWGLWRDAREMRERRREAVKKFPRIAPDWVPPHQWRLGPQAADCLVTTAERDRVSSWLRCEREEAERQRRKLVAPIDIPALLGDRLQEKSISDWLLVVLAAGTEGSAVWPQEALTSETGGNPKSRVCTLADSSGPRGRTRVRLLLGNCPASELKGCSGLLVIAGEEWDARERLELLEKVKARPPVPLCLLCTNELTSQVPALPACVGEVRMSRVGPELSAAGKRELERALQWLATESPPQPRLMCVGMREYVSDRMYRLFCKEAAGHAAERERTGVRGCPLGPISALFSAALNCVREELTGERVQEVNWPIKDEDLWEWNEAGTLETIGSCLDQLSPPSDLPEERLDLFLHRCRHSVPSYTALSAECESLTTRHIFRYGSVSLYLLSY